MIQLEIKNLEKYYGANLIFKDINFDVQSKERVAIVGRNGCGKTTIFNIISTKEQKDNGEVLIRKGSKIGYLEQIPKFENYKVKEVLNLAFANLLDIENNLRLLEQKMQSETIDLDSVLDKYSKLQLDYENRGGYEKDTAISKVCSGLNLNDDFLELEFETLSGGEKTRVLLAKILIERPDILLLDEPTNHLDMKSVEWLEDYLNDYDGSVIIISHDRYFLDRVVNKVVEIENLESKTYIGNYSSYVVQKEENFILQQQQYKEQQKKINAMEESIKQLKIFSRNGQNEKFVKRAQSMQKRLDKIEKLDNPNKKKDEMKINVINNTKQSEDVIIIKNGKKSFEDRLLFEDIDVLIRKGENVALIGENGCGKSTLIKIILQSEKLDKGEFKVANSSKIGYLPQEVVFENEEMTILEWFREDISILEGKAREYLAKYMFYKEDVFKKVKSLSGGEKTRLKLSKLLYFDINLLILDEPTNHLDIDSIKNLEKVLKDFTGSIFFVSHDRYFINSICNRILSIENNKVYNWNGNYDYYKEKSQDMNIKNQINELEKNNLNNDKVLNNENKLNNKAKIENSSKEETKKRSDKAKLEKEIETLEIEIKKINEIIETLSTEYEELEKYCKEKSIIEENLNNLLNEWIEI
ncbi:MAG: ribosomal protection-like ABC-F family protein [Peptostreptococcaceae bacterium]